MVLVSHPRGSNSPHSPAGGARGLKKEPPQNAQVDRIDHPVAVAVTLFGIGQQRRGYRRSSVVQSAATYFSDL